MWPSYIFHFFTKNSNLQTNEKFNIFCIIYDAMSNIHFSGLDNVKMTCITQVSFKITIRKWHVYIDICWPWKCNHYFYLAIWEDERSKIIFLPSFKLVTRLNSLNRSETSLLMNTDTLICIWILAFLNGIIQVSTPRKRSFLLYFSSLHDYWLPTTLTLCLLTFYIYHAPCSARNANVIYIYHVDMYIILAKLSARFSIFCAMSQHCISSGSFLYLARV